MGIRGRSEDGCAGAAGRAGNAKKGACSQTAGTVGPVWAFPNRAKGIFTSWLETSFGRAEMLEAFARWSPGEPHHAMQERTANML
eukprot:110152-Chlamydomonas_euryale.AAC.1